jgi:hypothetical protein
MRDAPQAAACKVLARIGMASLLESLVSRSAVRHQDSVLVATDLL